MGQFIVPKFIENEPKIVGPLTFKQFVFVGIAAGVSFLLFLTIPLPFSILTILIVILIGVGLAFGKINEKPLPEILKSFFVFSVSPKMYFWKKKIGPPPKFIEKPRRPQLKEVEKTPIPTALGRGRLKELTTQIETKTK